MWNENAQSWILFFENFDVKPPPADLFHIGRVGPGPPYVKPKLHKVEFYFLKTSMWKPPCRSFSHRAGPAGPALCGTENAQSWIFFFAKTPMWKPPCRSFSHRAGPAGPALCETENAQSWILFSFSTLPLRQSWKWFSENSYVKTPLQIFFT